MHLEIIRVRRVHCLVSQSRGQTPGIDQKAPVRCVVSLYTLNLPFFFQVAAEALMAGVLEVCSNRRRFFLFLYVLHRATYISF
jgi:hypothetical protein